MTIHALATSRRMTRAFRPDAVDPALVDRFIDAARRAPAAEFLVLEGADVARYWDVTLPAERRAGFPWPQLLLAPVLVLPFVEPDAYVRRYSEPDKSGTGLGVSEAAWVTPYWWVDGGMAVMTMLLAAEEAGLGALFFGVFEHENAVKARFGVPDARRADELMRSGALWSSFTFVTKSPPAPIPATVARGGWIATAIGSRPICSPPGR